MNTGDSLREIGAFETLTSVCTIYQRRYRTPPKHTLNVNSTDLESKFINNNQMHVRYPSKRYIDSRQYSPLQWPNCDSNILMAAGGSNKGSGLIKKTYVATSGQNTETFKFLAVALPSQHGAGIEQSWYSNLWTGQSAVRTPVGVRDFFFSNRPDRPYGPPSLQYYSYRNSFPQVVLEGVAGQRHAALTNHPF